MTNTNISTNTDINIAQQILIKMESVEATASPLVFRVIEVAAQLYQGKDVALTDKNPKLNMMLKAVGINLAIVEIFHRDYKTTSQVCHAFLGNSKELVERLNRHGGDFTYTVAMEY